MEAGEEVSRKSVDAVAKDLGVDIHDLIPDFDSDIPEMIAEHHSNAIELQNYALLEDSLKEFFTCVKMIPDFYPAYKHIAEIYDRLGEADRAIHYRNMYDVHKSYVEQTVYRQQHEYG